jgi:hypothetical protein
VQLVRDVFVGEYVVISVFDAARRRHSQVQLSGWCTRIEEEPLDVAIVVAPQRAGEAVDEQDPGPLLIELDEFAVFVDGRDTRPDWNAWEQLRRSGE